MANDNIKKNAAWSKRRGIEVIDRELKLGFFYNWDIGVDSERIRCAYVFTFHDRKGMAKELLLGDARLEGKDNRLSHETLKALGEYFGFDPTWKEWLRGTPREFAEKYNAENRYVPKVTASATADRRDDAGYAPGIQLISSRTEKPWSINHKLAALTLFANQEGGGATQSLAIELVCTPAPIEIFELTVRRGELFIECEGCEASEISERNANLNKENFQRTPNELAISAFGTHVRPGWKLAIENPPQTGWYITGDICDIRKLALGSSVTAWFAAYVKDLEPSRERVSTEQLSAGCHYSRAFKFEGSNKLSAMKKKVLELLADATVADEDGYVMLCGDRLRFDIHPGAREHTDNA